MVQQGVLGVRLVAKLEDDSREEVEIYQPKGHPDAPLDEASLMNKMTWLLEDIAPPDAPRRLYDLCKRLSTPEDLNALIDACRV